MEFDQNEFFRQATLRICGSLSLEAAMGATLRYLNTLLPAERMHMTLVDQEVSGLHTIVDLSLDGDVGPERYEPLDDEARQLLRQLRAEKLRSRIINEPSRDPIVRRTSLGRERPDYSVLAAPLWIQEEALGIVSLAAPGRGRYTERHAAWFALLNEPFAVALSNALQHRELGELKDLLADDNRYLHRELRQQRGVEIVGEEHGLREVMRAARHVAPRDSPVLLLGETGVGKDVVANVIHDLSPRRGGPFIKVNCGALPETLVDSELFGHERGAFTGAVSRVRGRFERSDGGTIFLDEIGDLPLAAQARLLRVLQFGEVERVGGRQALKLNIRVLAATHRDLSAMVAEGSFRADLMYRLDVFPIYLPPLRDRPEDLPALVRHLAARKRRQLRLPAVPELAPGGLEQLRAYDWPGNVRELENVVERALIRRPESPLRFDELITRSSDPLRPLPPEDGPPPTLDELIGGYLRELLSRTGGRINGPAGAAALAGVHPSTLRGRLRRLGIPFGRATR